MLLTKLKKDGHKVLIFTQFPNLMFPIFED